MTEGSVINNIELELIKDSGISRPRMRPVEGYPKSTRVEVSRKLREMFPLKTRFLATVKVCQKHWKETGKPKGDPYFKAIKIGVIVSSIPDKGFVAKLDPAGADERFYYYIYE
jgi:hypothetical protein